MIDIIDLDNELFLQIQNADEQAFSTLFRKYYKLLYVFASGFVKDPQIAEEIVQDVFVKIWVNKTEINITHSIKAYLYTAVKNHSLNYLKQNKRFVSIDERLEQVIPGKDSPEAGLINMEHQEAIHKAIEELPGQCRRIFKMKKYDDLSYIEISEILGISVNTIKTQMKRAMKSLLKKLEYLRLILFFLT